MFSNLFVISLAAGCYLASLASASRTSDVAHRKGFAPNFKPRVIEHLDEQLKPRQQTYRFLNNATQGWLSFVLLKSILIMKRFQGRLPPRHSF